MLKNSKKCREQSGRIAQGRCCLIYPPRTADKLYVCEFFEEKLGGRIAQGRCCLIYPPRTADKLYVYEFFFEKLGVRIAYEYAILTQLTKIEKSSIFNLLL